jgi:hypothetical protein
MITVKSKVQEVSIAAVVTRTDGSVEDLGIIAYNNKNPFKMLKFKLKKFKGRWNKWLMS